MASDGEITKLVDGERIVPDEQERQQIIERQQASQPTLAEAQSAAIDDIKTAARDVLTETDWYVIRKQETGVSIPAAILDHRATVRDQSETYEADINALTTVEAVESYSFSYPDPPSP
jgi:hypothetical protein